MNPNRSFNINTFSLLAILFDGFINRRGGEIPTRALIGILKAFGLTENATRQALFRDTRGGSLHNRRQGRNSFYSLTPYGMRRMESGRNRMLTKDPDPWDCRWRLVVYNIPERLRPRREKLRAVLSGLRFANIGAAAWISPFDRIPALTDACKRLGLTRYVEVYSAEHVGFREDRAQAYAVWGLEVFEQEYRRYIQHYGTVLKTYRASGKRLCSLDPQRAFVDLYRCGADYIAIADEDPILPVELLPPDWPRAEARSIYFELWELIYPLADRFIDEMLNEPVQKHDSIRTSYT